MKLFSFAVCCFAAEHQLVMMVILVMKTFLKVCTHSCDEYVTLIRVVNMRPHL